MKQIKISTTTSMNFYYNVTEAQVATSKERIEVANKNMFLLQYYLKFVMKSSIAISKTR